MHTVVVNDAQLALLKRTFANVTINGQLTPLISIVNILNAVNGTDPKNFGLTPAHIQNFNGIFGNVTINNLPVQLQEAIEVHNILSSLEISATAPAVEETSQEASVGEETPPAVN